MKIIKRKIQKKEKMRKYRMLYVNFEKNQIFIFALQLSALTFPI